MDVQDLIVQLSHIGRRIQAPQEFIQKGMPLLLQALDPLAKRLRFYRAVPQGLILVAMSDEGTLSQDMISYDDRPLYREVLETNQVTVDSQNRYVLAPITITDPQEILLEVELTDQGSLEYGRPFLRERIGTVTQLFQFMLSDMIKTWALDKLTIISSLLNQATDFESIAKILGENLVTRGQFASVNLLDYDFSGSPKGFWVVATASLTQTLTPNVYVALEDVDFNNLAPLQDNKDVLLYNLPTVPIGEPVRKLLNDSHIRAMHIVPLRISGRTIGFINTNDTRLLLANLDAEQRVIRGLSGQVGAIVDNRRLLTEAESSLTETRTLYEASRRLMSSQTLHEVLHIIYDTFAKPDGRVGLTEYRYDEEGRPTGAYVRYIVVNGQGVESEQPLHVGMTNEERSIVRARREDTLNDISFVENIPKPGLRFRLWSSG